VLEGRARPASKTLGESNEKQQWTPFQISLYADGRSIITLGGRKKRERETSKEEGELTEWGARSKQGKGNRIKRDVRIGNPLLEKRGNGLSITQSVGGGGLGWIRGDVWYENDYSQFA